MQNYTIEIQLNFPADEPHEALKAFIADMPTIRKYRPSYKVINEKGEAELAVLSGHTTPVRTPEKGTPSGKCPECGAELIAQPRGGIKCSKCDYWFFLLT